MYNLPQIRAVNAAFWDVELLVQGITAVSPALAFELLPVARQIEPTTLFTQGCGYPLQTIYRVRRDCWEALFTQLPTAKGQPLPASSWCIAMQNSSTLLSCADAPSSTTAGIPTPA